ncbi:hypothetical protein BOS5A_211272 [Bosea sp. EC-HK365B]|nr:conserved hypothetical protein [Bosea sp. 21B]VVT60481.1 hypothetical protein BOS5A_211272 [Bosea sp. EC-HK365B]VXC94424.1 conserved hypothetical protein [Bosea sp. 125]
MGAACPGAVWPGWRLRPEGCCGWAGAGCDGAVPGCDKAPGARPAFGAVAGWPGAGWLGAACPG